MGVKAKFIHFGGWALDRTWALARVGTVIKFEFIGMFLFATELSSYPQPAAYYGSSACPIDLCEVETIVTPAVAKDQVTR